MSRNYQEKALNSMFPKPVNNVEEVINKESCIDGNQVCEEKIVENLKVNPIKKNDIFMKPKNRKENIVLKVEDGEKNVKKDRYAHLAEARKKGAETRRLKAIARKAKKDEEKEEKQRKKEEKKKASVERNRQRARDRYYAKQETKNKIMKEDGTLNVKSKPINIPKMPEARQGNKEMDFNTFASHMLKYENMKQRYFNEANKRKQQKQQRIQEIKKPPEYHPKNYPLSNIYNPANRKNTSFF